MGPEVQILSGTPANNAESLCFPGLSALFIGKHEKAPYCYGASMCQKASTLLYRECRGEHCSPAAISGNVRFHGSIWNAPLREPKRPPCVKGAGCAAAQTEGLRPYGYNPTRPYTLQSLRHGLRRATRLRVGPLCRFATSPHTVGSHPLHKGGL